MMRTHNDPNSVLISVPPIESRTMNAAESVELVTAFQPKRWFRPLPGISALFRRLKVDLGITNALASDRLNLDHE
ncbi:MAG: hypothetical protein AAF539_00165 [Planctomycetota bacterium]